MKNLPNNIKGIVLTLAGFSLFSISDAFVKYLSTQISFYVITFFLSFFSALVLIAFSSKLGGLKKTIQSKNKMLHILRGVLLLIQFLLLVYAFSHMSMAKTYALIFIAPFVISILSIPILKQSVSWQNWWAIIAGFTGVLIILRPGLIPIDLAALAALVSAVLFALVYIIAAKIGNKNEASLSFALYPEVIILCLAALLMADGFVMPKTQYLGMLAISGITSAFGMVFVAQGFIYAKTSTAALFHYVQILWAILFGLLVFHDNMDVWEILGSTIIIGSGILMVRHENKKSGNYAETF